MRDEGIYLHNVDLRGVEVDRVYVTRDSDDETGELSAVCEVWSARPHRDVCEGSRGAMWLGRDADGLPSADALVGRYSVEGVKRWIRGACPDTDRECVTVTL